MKIVIKILLFVIMLLLSGCATPTETPSLPVTDSPQPATATYVSPSPTSTFELKTPTPTATPTAILIPTKTPTATATSTPHPTLSADDAKVLILKLVQQHEDCQLPCLLGFVPGKSDVEAARTFVEQFGIGDFWIGDIELGAHNYDGGGGVGIAYPEENILIIIHWSYNQGKENANLELLWMKLAAMEKLGTDPSTQLPIMSPVYGNTIFSQEFQDYSLSSILTVYGQPYQVLVMARPDEPQRPDIQWYPFSLALVYPEQGIFVEFVSARETNGEKYAGCPNKAHIYIATWDLQGDLYWENIVDRAGVETRMSNSLPLEEATSMTLDGFFEVFKNSNNTTCIETPIDLWPPQ